MSERGRRSKKKEHKQGEVIADEQVTTALIVCNTHVRCGHHVILRHINGSYPAATLRLTCGYLVSEEVFVSSLEELNLAKFCWIKCTLSFKTHTDKWGKQFCTSLMGSHPLN